METLRLLLLCTVVSSALGCYDCWADFLARAAPQYAYRCDAYVAVRRDADSIPVWIQTWVGEREGTENDCKVEAVPR
eukprot:m51a1_g10434 hypothetical protein (77) ;mRNA; r:48829-49346